MLGPFVTEPASADFQGSVAYIGNNTTELHIKDLSGGTDSLVSFASPFAYIDTPQWSSDGQWITFSAQHAGEGMQVYVSKPDGTQLRRVTDGTGTWSSPSFSPDGQRIVCHESYGDMFIYSLDGSPRTHLPTGKHTRWSPVDPNKIAFSNWTGDFGNSDVFIYDRNLGTSTQLTHHETGHQAFNYGAWSPDGTHLALSALTDGLYDVWLIGADGSGLTNLTLDWPTRDSFYPSWSPDGQYIVFQSAEHGGIPDLWSMSYADPSIRLNLTNTSTIGEFSPAATVEYAPEPAPVPEPISLASGAIGLACVGACLRRRRQKEARPA